MVGFQFFFIECRRMSKKCNKKMFGHFHLGCWGGMAQNVEGKEGVIGVISQLQQWGGGGREREGGSVYLTNSTV